MLTLRSIPTVGRNVATVRIATEGRNTPIRRIMTTRRRNMSILRNEATGRRLETGSRKMKNHITNIQIVTNHQKLDLAQMNQNCYTKQLLQEPNHPKMVAHRKSRLKVIYFLTSSLNISCRTLGFEYCSSTIIISNSVRDEPSKKLTPPPRVPSTAYFLAQAAKV